MGVHVDRTGHRFGMLTAIERTQRMLSSGRLMPAWKLRCDCGVEVVAMTVNLTRGRHQSCGCSTAALISGHYRGDTKLPEYRVYRQMLDRCYLESAPNYSWYGGKGVTVCDRWRHGTGDLTGFQCFMADMGERPVGLTLERDDPRLPYEPGNCRWATWQEQAANRREDYLPGDERRRIRSDRQRARRKITPEVRQEVLRRLAAGERQVPLASALGLSQTTISGIKTGVR